MKKNPERCEQVRNIIKNSDGLLRVIIGSAHIGYPGWIDTDHDILDILKEEEWHYLLGEKQIDLLLSEHVLEHIDQGRQLSCLELCYKFLKPGGIFRLAVPDGYRIDDLYREEIMPPKDGHTMVFDYLSLQEILHAAGFRTTLLEYFDENGIFHAREWDPELGMVRRSARFDNQDQFQIQSGERNLKYTSLIIDAVKP